MGKDDVFEVYKAAPNAKIICVHMEAVNHGTLSREELKSFASEKEISTNVSVEHPHTTQYLQQHIKFSRLSV